MNSFVHGIEVRINNRNKLKTRSKNEDNHFNFSCLIYENKKIFHTVFSINMQNYFGDAWNVFDFIIVLGSFIDIVYSEVNVSSFS